MKPFSLAVICICAVLSSTAAAQEPSKPTSQQPSNSYVPDLSDLMAITALRHARLSYSAEVSNWKLADYEIAKLRTTFNVAMKLYPVFQDVHQAKLIADATEPAVQAIEKAIKARDLPGFHKSFKDLTNACNSCHEQAKREFIVIQIPYNASSPYSNQAFPR